MPNLIHAPQRLARGAAKSLPNVAQNRRWERNRRALDSRRTTPPFLCRATLFAGLLLLTLASATGQPFAIEKHTIGGGGGISASGQYSVKGTVGQPAAHNPSTNGPYSVKGGFWSVAAVIQTPGAPLLSIRQVAGSYEIFWSAEASGFVLEETQSLTGDIQWDIVTQPPALDNGQNTIPFQSAAGTRFYRLRKQ